MKFSRFYVDVSNLTIGDRLSLVNMISMQSFMVLHKETFKLTNADGFEFLTDADMTCDEAITAFRIPANCPVRGVRVLP